MQQHRVALARFDHFGRYLLRYLHHAINQLIHHSFCSILLHPHSVSCWLPRRFRRLLRTSLDTHWCECYIFHRLFHIFIFFAPVWNPLVRMLFHRNPDPRSIFHIDIFIFILSQLIHHHFGHPLLKASGHFGRVLRTS